MSYTVELHQKAILELQDSYNWYEARVSGLGQRFIDVIDKRLVEIALHPKRYPKMKKQYREVAVKTFPYVVIYEVLEKQKTVLVLHVFHTRRNPRNKY